MVKKFNFKEVYAIFFLTFLIFLTGHVKGEGWLPGWQYRIPVTIVERSGGNLVDYQVVINLNTRDLYYNLKIRGDCRDLRVTDGDGVTPLPYWYDFKTCVTNNTIIIVRLNISAYSQKKIYIYYGNINQDVSLSQMWYNVKHLGIYDGVFNYNSSLGRDGYSSYELMYMKKVCIGDTISCAIKKYDEVECWGSMRGNFTIPYVKQISCGYSFMCASTYDGLVFCNDGSSYTGGDALMVSSGLGHKCVLKKDGNVFCFGRNDYGQANSYNGSDAIYVSTGAYHTCILKRNGNVQCWGYRNDTYDSGDAIYVSAGSFFTCVLTKYGNATCWGMNIYPSPLYISGNNIIQIEGGGHHVCVLTKDGDVGCYSYNIFGEGTSHFTKDIVYIATSWQTSCVLYYNGTLWCYGYCVYGQCPTYSGIEIPYRKYVYPEPYFVFGSEENVTQVPPTVPPTIPPTDEYITPSLFALLEILLSPLMILIIFSAGIAYYVESRAKSGGYAFLFVFTAMLLAFSIFTDLIPKWIIILVLSIFIGGIMLLKR